jgi:hypothetical protein
VAEESYIATLVINTDIYQEWFDAVLAVVVSRYQGQVYPGIYVLPFKIAGDYDTWMTIDEGAEAYIQNAGNIK